MHRFAVTLYCLRYSKAYEDPKKQQILHFKKSMQSNNHTNTCQPVVTHIASGRSTDALTATTKKKRAGKESQEATRPLQPIRDYRGISPANLTSHLIMASRPAESP